MQCYQSSIILKFNDSYELVLFSKSNFIILEDLQCSLFHEQITHMVLFSESKTYRASNVAWFMNK